mmetsp:Transcript_20490/g.47318  ORF Transcript_20490/g.47318 Transcript_20490/m.47318 type:complete len:96 (-) Transcript_20490:481-768(-)
MADLEAAAPPKCPMCKAVIPQESFERQLNTEQQRAFAMLLAERSQAEGEEMVHCNQCDYYQIRTDRPTLFLLRRMPRGALHRVPQGAGANRRRGG